MITQHSGPLCQFSIDDLDSSLKIFNINLNLSGSAILYKGVSFIQSVFTETSTYSAVFPLKGDYGPNGKSVWELFNCINKNTIIEFLENIVEHPLGYQIKDELYIDPAKLNISFQARQFLNIKLKDVDSFNKTEFTYIKAIKNNNRYCLKSAQNPSTLLWHTCKEVATHYCNQYGINYLIIFPRMGDIKFIVEKANELYNKFFGISPLRVEEESMIVFSSTGSAQTYSNDKIGWILTVIRALEEGWSKNTHVWLDDLFNRNLPNDIIKKMDSTYNWVHHLNILSREKQTS